MIPEHVLDSRGALGDKEDGFGPYIMTLYFSEGDRKRILTKVVILVFKMLIRVTKQSIIIIKNM